MLIDVGYFEAMTSVDTLWMEEPLHQLIVSFSMFFHVFPHD